MKKMEFNQVKLYREFALKRRSIEKEENRFVSRKEIALKIGVSRVTLYRVISGEVVPDLKTLAKICMWIGKPIDDFIN